MLYVSFFLHVFVDRARNHHNGAQCIVGSSLSRGLSLCHLHWCHFNYPWFCCHPVKLAYKCKDEVSNNFVYLFSQFFAACILFGGFSWKQNVHLWESQGWI